MRSMAHRYWRVKTEREEKNTMSVYCIIPARKGSKRVPNKNFRMFCGAQMVERAVKKSDKAGLCTYISTDRNDYCGTIVIHRQGDLANDECGLIDVIKDAIFSFSERDMIINDSCIFVCLLPCTPLLKSETLRRAVESYKKNYAATNEMMVSVCEYPHTLARALEIMDSVLYMEDRDSVLARTQDCPTYYHDAGQFYIATAKRWLSGEPILADGAKPWLLPRWEAVDIDTEEDWRLAELIYRGMQHDDNQDTQD